jgi:Zn-dependent protease
MSTDMFLAHALRLLRRLWSFLPLFRVAGVPVRLHTTWFLFPGGLLLLGGLEWHGIWFGFGFLGALLVSMLTHEFAHVFAARRYGCNTNRVLIIPFGCVADMEAIPLGAAEVWVAAAGPLASLLLSGLAWLFGRAIGPVITETRWYLQAALSGFSILNLMMAGFNLLPCFPMDGGRIVRGSLAVLIRLVCPQRGFGSAVVLATRIALRHVARPIVAGIVFVTVFYTHLWHHILFFGLVPLAGEAEFWALKRAWAALGKPCELRFLPITAPFLAKHVRGHTNRNPHERAMGSLQLRLDPRGMGCAFRPCLAYDPA